MVWVGDADGVPHLIILAIILAAVKAVARIEP
jgi:hypothetical protein